MYWQIEDVDLSLVNGVKIMPILPVFRTNTGQYNTISDSGQRFDNDPLLPIFSVLIYGSDGRLLGRMTNMFDTTFTINVFFGHIQDAHGPFTNGSTSYDTTTYQFIY